MTAKEKSVPLSWESSLSRASGFDAAATTPNVVAGATTPSTPAEEFSADGPSRKGKIFVVENECKFALPESATIVLESEVRAAVAAHGDLVSGAARRLALAYAAAKGVRNPALNGTSNFPFPVNSHGDSAVFSDKSVPNDDPRKQPAAYRVAIAIRGM